MDASKIIDLLGGTSATAKFFRVKPASVSEWRRTGIPASRMQTLEYARPEIFRDVGESDVPEKKVA